jgi:hypothetical protein
VEPRVPLIKLQISCALDGLVVELNTKPVTDAAENAK